MSKKFYCPLSPLVMWHAGLRYSECPLVSSERDMPGCQDCELQGDNAPKAKAKRRRKKEKEAVQEKRQQRKQEVVPTINKTYVSKE